MPFLLIQAMWTCFPALEVMDATTIMSTVIPCTWNENRYYHSKIFIESCRKTITNLSFSSYSPHLTWASSLTKTSILAPQSTPYQYSYQWVIVHRLFLYVDFKTLVLCTYHNRRLHEMLHSETVMSRSRVREHFAKSWASHWPFVAFVILWLLFKKYIHAQDS